MQIVTTIAELRAHLRSKRGLGRRIGLVPTMGYLHAGHLALVEQARAECDLVVASIFVNPLQFGPHEDFDRYPRDLERDCALLAPAGVDLVFSPPVAEMYPQPTQTYVEVAGLGDHLCGASRPGHFRGVATVVAKLLHIVVPDSAYFGEKDFQQLQIIRHMVADLSMNTEIIGVPTVREPDGLAMSSRNVYLQGAQRETALVLYQALQRARARVAAGERDAAALVEDLRRFISAEPLARVDYVAAVDAETLQSVDRLAGRVLVALAVFIGRTRLIDNICLEVS